MSKQQGLPSLWLLFAVTTSKVAKKVKLSTLKNKRWKLTSEYVRRSNADPHTGMSGCVTCRPGTPGRHYKELQAGHFIPQAQGNAVKWDLRNIHPQCYRCNINLGGNGAEYYPFMLERYGQEVIDELRFLSNTTVKITASDHKEAIIELERLLEEL